MDSGLEQVDFAWLGYDDRQCLAIFFVPIERSPVFVQLEYRLEQYNQITDFIIDELPVIGSAETLSENARLDAEKGFYVYEYQNGSGIYKRVAVLKVELLSSALREFSLLLVDLAPHSFVSAKELSA